jgi:hypothetical protein
MVLLLLLLLKHSVSHHVTNNQTSRHLTWVVALINRHNVTNCLQIFLILMNTQACSILSFH